MEDTKKDLFTEQDNEQDEVQDEVQDKVQDKAHEPVRERVRDNLSEIDFSKTMICGTDEQKALFFSDYAKYYGEVSHPKNTKTNPHFRNKYAPLDEVFNATKETLSKYNLALIQSVSVEERSVGTSNILVHSSGAYMSFKTLSLPADKPTAQGVGSAITYGRRYSASAILGVASEEDDDGNVASGGQPTKTTQKPVAKQTTKQATKQVAKQATKEKPKSEVDPRLKSEMVELIKDKAGENQAKVVEVLNSVIGSANYQKVESNEQIEKIIELVGEI